MVENQSIIHKFVIYANLYIYNSNLYNLYVHDDSKRFYKHFKMPAEYYYFNSFSDIIY